MLNLNDLFASGDLGGVVALLFWVALAIGGIIRGHWFS